MSDAITGDFYRAMHDLLAAGVVYMAFTFARGSSAPKLIAMTKGLLWCSGIALVGALMLGQPSCDSDDDPLHGGCDEYRDDGYVPLRVQREGRFVYVFLLLAAPVVIGVGGRPEVRPRI